MDCRIKIIVLLVFSPQIAAAGLFDMLNEQYINEISELPYSSGIPEIEWQRTGHITAWIDIVGFRNLSRDNNNFFILGDPASLAIIQYDAKDVGVSGSVQKITKTLTTSRNNNFTVAVLNIELYWKSIQCYDSDCWEVPHHETATFQDTETSPEQFDKVHKPQINIVEYNNSIEPKITITVIEPNASKIMIQYGDYLATHTQNVYHVEVTEKGVYYVNTTPIDIWDVHGFARFGNTVIINTNLSAFDYSQLNITISDIFGSVHAEQEQFNITRVTYDPERIVYNPLLFGFIGTLLTLFGASAYLIGRI